MTRTPKRLLVVLASLAVVGAGGAAAAGMVGQQLAAVQSTVAVSAVPGESTAIRGFMSRASAQTSDTGAVLSRPGYSTTGWFPVGPRSTVFAGLLANNRFPDPFFSTNMRNVPTSDYTVPWWYRADFTLGSETGLRTYINISGVLSRADMFVNGSQIATSSQIYGVYTSHERDVTSLVHEGVNSIAIRVLPNDPNRDLTMGWIDWTQIPPDKNKANVRDDSAAALTATVTGTVAGSPLSQAVSLAAHETKSVTFPAVTLTNAQLWWPAGM